jgi:hypothetical protein
MLRPRQLRGEQALYGSLFVSHSATIHGLDNHHTGFLQFTQQDTSQPRGSAGRSGGGVHNRYPPTSALSQPKIGVW